MRLHAIEVESQVETERERARVFVAYGLILFRCGLGHLDRREVEMRLCELRNTLRELYLYRSGR